MCGPDFLFERLPLPDEPEGVVALRLGTLSAKHHPYAGTPVALGPDMEEGGHFNEIL
ncbi:MAG: hypothetical protein HN750_06145 [Gemmatimonadales bacterium]|nr:hypothetical protein [Gemmatimonadales bacterium]